MAKEMKETIAKENPVADALRRLKEDEADLTGKLKPVQEAIAALEKIIEKSVKKEKVKPTKENAGEATLTEEEGVLELTGEAQ